MTQLSHPAPDRRLGLGRRSVDGDPGGGATPPESPIASWPLHVPDPLRSVRTGDPWARVVHLAILDACCDSGTGDAAWEDRATWRVEASDPTADRAESPDGAGRCEAVGSEAIRAWHRELLRLTDGTYRQELVSLEAGRGPLVQAHLRTTARRAGRALDVPTLLAFLELALTSRVAVAFRGSSSRTATN